MSISATIIGDLLTVLHGPTDVALLLASGHDRDVVPRLEPV
jgi:hypothetical protein